MCNQPITQIDRTTKAEVTFACGKCKECLAARINDWVARGMAEKAMSGETLVIRLSYRNNPDGTLPQGAIAFDYADIQVFLKRLREQYYEKYQARGEIRYLSCGERGNRGTKRVHYHMVLFARRPVTALGEWVNAYDDTKKGFQTEKDLLWKTSAGDMWDHGHVHCQVPDQGGIFYALKYAMADQFNSVKSKGTRRYVESTDNSASHFRQSRKPPIGFSWLESTLDEWESRLILPPTLDLKPPEYKGYWYPKGKMRDYLLTRVRDINEKCREKLGRDAAAWTSLLASVMSREEEWEYLKYGKIEEEIEEVRNPKYEWDDDTGWQEVRQKCGGFAVCGKCFHNLDWEKQREYRRWRAEAVESYVTDKISAEQSIDEWFRAQQRVNPFCYKKGDDYTRDGAFA